MNCFNKSVRASVAVKPAAAVAHHDQLRPASASGS
jgi:hypothetical protein